MLEELFKAEDFIRILVYFDIPDDVLKARVIQSQRSTNIFRGAYSNFEEVLARQQAEKEDIVNPSEDEADYLFVIKDNDEVNVVIQKIIQIAERM